MSDNEMRRRALLNEARQQRYSGFLPAVHPRYQASYHSIYPADQPDAENGSASSLYIRLVLSLCLFFAFLFCDYKNITWNGLDTYTIEQQISADYGWEAVSQLGEKILSEK